MRRFSKEWHEAKKNKQEKIVKSEVGSVKENHYFSPSILVYSELGNKLQTSIGELLYIKLAGVYYVYIPSKYAFYRVVNNSIVPATYERDVELKKLFGVR